MTNREKELEDALRKVNEFLSVRVEPSLALSWDDYPMCIGPRGTYLECKDFIAKNKELLR